MSFTVLFARIVGPVLLVRAISILLDRKHFSEMIAGLEKEISTVSFSFFPIALLMAALAIVNTHSDTSSPAALLIHLIAWAGVLKGTALMLFPNLVAAKVGLLEKAGFLNVVLTVCLAVGAYFCWFGYLA